MLSEKVLFALNDVNDSFLEEAGELLQRTAVPRRRGTGKIGRVFLIAAILAMLMTATAYAVYRATMAARVPEEGTTEYHVVYSADPEIPAKLYHVDFDKTKIALSFDVPAGGFFPVMRAENLPGAEENWQESSFYRMLETAQYFGLPWEMRTGDPGQMEIDPEREPTELLAAAGMDADTAKTWFTGYTYRGEGSESAGEQRDLFRIDLYGGYRLHGQEVILGAFSSDGTEASAVQEGTLGDYQMLEVQMLLAGGAVDNHLFLFHPEKYYLLHISGNGTACDFPTLEQIGKELEVQETGLYAESYEDKVNFILGDLAAG